MVNDYQYKYANDFKVEGIPTKYIINKNGNIVFKETGGALEPDLFTKEMAIMIEIALSAN